MVIRLRRKNLIIVLFLNKFPILQQPRLFKKTQFSLTLILPVPVDLVSYRMGDIWLVVVFYVMLQAIFTVAYSYVGIVFTLILFLIVCVCVLNITIGCVCVTML
jgi:hypothetical protein